jgi:hypothetical protein
LPIYELPLNVNPSFLTIYNFFLSKFECQI